MIVERGVERNLKGSYREVKGTYVLLQLTNSRNNKVGLKENEPHLIV